MAAYMYGQSVESRVSPCVTIVLLRASVRVPLIDTLDTPVTDEDSTTNQSTTSTFFFRIIDRPPVTVIGKHRHWSLA